MQLKKKNDCLIIEIDAFGEVWETKFLLSSDEHYDSKGCDRELLKRDWGIAKENKIPILNFGDFFDVMGKKFDPRTNMLDIRPEYKEADNKDMYLDLIAKDGVKFLDNYNVLMMVEGNHEYEIRKRSEMNFLQYVTNSIHSKPYLMGYDGYVRFIFNITKTRKQRIDLYYTHGTGGASPVTKGAITAQRRQHDINADIYVSGHTHQAYEIPKVIRYLDGAGIEQRKKVLHISLPTFKTDRDQWGKMKGFGNTDAGSRFLNFYKDKSIIKFEATDVR